MLVESDKEGFPCHEDLFAVVYVRKQFDNVRYPAFVGLELGYRLRAIA